MLAQIKGRNSERIMHGKKSDQDFQIELVPENIIKKVYQKVQVNDVSKGVNFTFYCHHS